MDEKSIYDLIGALVKTISTEYDLECDDLLLKKCRSKAFEILLGKTKAVVPEQNAIYSNPIDELMLHQFEMKMDSNYAYQDQICDEYDQCLENILENENELSSEDITVLKFLVCLRNTGENQKTNNTVSLFENVLTPSRYVGPYPIFNSDAFKMTPKYMHNIFGDVRKNPYMIQSRTAKTDDEKTALFFSEKLSSVMTICCRDNNAVPDECSFFSDELSKNRIIPNMNFMANKANIELLTQYQMINNKTIAPKNEHQSKEIRFNFNWENLGNRYAPLETSFASECNSSLHLFCMEANKLRKFPEIKVVSQEKLLNDVKYLIVGISSESFIYEDYFKMIPNLTVDGISLKSFRNIIQPMLEFGTCFKRLLKMTKRFQYNFKMIFDGFVFEAFCSCVENFLAGIRLVVMTYEEKSILKLFSKINKMKDQIVVLAKFCGIHPNYESDKEFPTGSLFLDYLYKEIIQVTQSDVATFLIYILKHCCFVYFSHFRKWMFQGHLEDVNKELFIYFEDHYLPNTKYFFDKAYLIKRQAVPGFLKGYEEDILLCGKYTMLLKAFKPTHPIFTLNAPKLNICLSYDSKELLQKECLEYLNAAQKLCGESVSVKQIYQNKQKEKEMFYKIVENNIKKNLEKWKDEQEIKAIKVKKMKEKQMVELMDQINEIRENKLAAKKAELELDLQYNQQYLELENKKLLAENLERQKTVEHYEELNQMIEMKRKRAEDLVAKLKIEIHVDQHDQQHGDDLIEGSENDFESCIGSVDDVLSVYEDAHKSPRSLCSLISNNDNEDNDNTIIENLFPDKIGTDQLNFNEVISESQKNKQKVLGSTINNYFQEDHQNSNVEVVKTVDFNNLTDAQRNKMKILSEEFNIPCTMPQDIEDINKNQTERQRNKEKVMSSDIAYQTIKNNNVPKVSVGREMSDLEKNRLKIMGHEHNLLPEDRDCNKKKSSMFLNLDTDRARNRKKVLECEYNILTGESNYPGTPMSIDSDTVSEDLQHDMDECDEEDMNANPIRDVSRTLLKLDTNAAKETSLKRFGIPDTAMNSKETPISALNTAGILLKTGFQFPAKEDIPKSTSFLDIALPDNDIESDEIYKTFVETLAKRDNTFFHIRSIKSNASQYLPNDDELKSIDVSTLTRFLQMSLVIPLNAHMEVVNNEILKMYLNDLDILGHFESLRNYFFLMDGEFGGYVCDSLFHKLENVKKPEELLNYHTLHSVLDNALCSSAQGSDKNAERLSFIVQQIPEKFDLYLPNVFNMLNLSYRVEWPLNLILNLETIEQYTNVFKYLVKVRRISWVLEKSFQLLKESHKQYGNRVLTSPQYRRVQLIRHKLFQLVNALKNYITSGALHASWQTFRKDLESTNTMEDLYRKHTTYIKRILFLCLLNKKSVEFYNNIEEIFKVVLKFYKHLKSRCWRLIDKNDSNSFYSHPKYNQMIADETDFEKLIKYTIYLGNKMVDYGYQKEISEFINVININGYYD